jgi:glycosyltransferase involved in cell wall biosynthesis
LYVKRPSLAALHAAFHDGPRLVKILMITGSYPPMRCGVGDYTQRLVAALRQRNEVSVLTGASIGTSTADQVHKFVRTWRRGAVADLKVALERTRPDIVHIQFPTQGYDSVTGLVAIAAHCRLRAKLPVVATMHEYLPDTFGQVDRHIYALAILAIRILVVRPQYHERIPRRVRLLMPSKKIRFIGNASSVPAVTMTPGEREAAKRALGAGSARIVAFFGFSYPHKGVDQLFSFASPALHHLLLIGEITPHDPYHARLLELAASPEWKGKVTITGFVDPQEAGRLLACADAVAFPYRGGGGVWNSSLHAALSQETFILATSADRRGYDQEMNIYYAEPDNLNEMRSALLAYQGMRGRKRQPVTDAWSAIAIAHEEVYASLLKA